MGRPPLARQPLSSLVIMAVLFGGPGLLLCAVALHHEMSPVYGVVGWLSLVAAAALVLVALVAWAAEIGVCNAHVALGERAGARAAEPADSADASSQ